MIGDLPSLVQPLSEVEFLTMLRQRRLSLVRGAGLQRYEALLGWRTLNQLLDSATYPAARLRVVRESIPIPASFYIRDGAIDPVALSRLMDQGVSLIFNGLENYVPALSTLCRQLATATAEQITAGAIVTSGSGGAIERHYDSEDLVILQIAGTKRWHIYGSPVSNPVKGMPAVPFPGGAPIFDEVLTAGDFLFLPAGYWHHCENGPGRSLHCGIFFDPPNGRHLVTGLAKTWLSDDACRRPLTRHDSASSLGSHEEALKAKLIEKIQEWSLASFIAEYRSQRSSAEVRLEGDSEPVPVAAHAK
jgi:bifunctional lysine-specific demethylase and histidyl-hydroxylase NO66